jgi:hypothetical protein
MDRDSRVVGTLVPNPELDLEIDYAGRKLNVFSSRHCKGGVVYWPAQAIAVVPMSLGGPHATVPVSIEGHTLHALIDSGAANTIMTLNTAKTWYKLDYNGPDVEKIGQIGSSSEYGSIYRHRFKNISFDGVSVTNPNIILRPNQNGVLADSFDGVSVTNPNIILRPNQNGVLADLTLGADILSKMHLYFSFEERKVYITAADPPPAASSPPLQ